MRGLIIDTETTGVDPAEDRVVQLGAAWIDTSTGECPAGEAHSIIIDPEVEIPDGASKVHGIYDADVWRKPTISNVLPQLKALVSEADFVVTFNGGRFDIPLLNSECDRVGHPRLFDDKPHIDVWNFTEWWDRHRRPRTLVKACEGYGVELPDEGNAHSADYDCILTGRLLAKMVEGGCLPPNPMVIAEMSRQRAEMLANERADLGLALYRCRSGDPEALFFGMGSITGTPFSDGSKLNIVQRVAVRRSIEHEDTPDRIKAILEPFASCVNEWKIYGGVVTLDPSLGELVMAVGKHEGRRVSATPSSYLRMMLVEFDDLTDGARELLKPLASSVEDYERFDIWMYNDPARKLCIGAGKWAGRRISEVDGGYLSGMRKWGPDCGVNKEVIKLVGWELGQRAKRNRGRR